jgi:hypothetical protein
MYDLEDLFADAEQTEFLIVTATGLAAREIIRLLNDLTFEAPTYRSGPKLPVVNRVLNDDGERCENVHFLMAGN